MVIGRNRATQAIRCAYLPFILIAVAYYGYKSDYSLSPEEGKRLREWVLLANSKGGYSRGSSETILAGKAPISSKVMVRYR